MFILFGNCTAAWGWGIKFWGFNFKEQWQCRVTVRLCWPSGAPEKAQTLPVNEGCAGFLVLCHSWASPVLWSWASASLYSSLYSAFPLSGQSLAEHTQPGWLQWRGQQNLWMQFVHKLMSCETAPLGFFFQNGHGIAASGQAVCVLWSTPCFRFLDWL